MMKDDTHNDTVTAAKNGVTHELNKYSKTFTQDPTQPAAQAMLYGIESYRERYE